MAVSRFKCNTEVIPLKEIASNLAQHIIVELYSLPVVLTKSSTVWTVHTLRLTGQPKESASLNGQASPREYLKRPAVLLKREKSTLDVGFFFNPIFK